MDIRIQHAIREELLKDFDVFKSKSAATILINIKTNEIISMVSFLTLTLILALILN